MSGAELLFAGADEKSPARVLIVAEIGVNHDGQLDRGLELIRAAAQVGADAVKLQLFSPDRLLSDQALLAGYQKDKAQSVKELLGELALGLESMSQLAHAARQSGLSFIVTPFSPADARELAQIGVDAVKIASPDAVNTPLLEAVSALGKPMLVSTGTCELYELEPVSDLIKNHPAGGCLLQCVSSYPTPTHDASLGGIVALRKRFSLPVGYSDHTTDPMTGALAVAAGAVVLEKHLTYDTKAKGPDHAASFDPKQFAEYVRLIRQAQTMLGPTAKQVLPVEVDVRKVSRQSVCVLRDLPAGHRLEADDLTVKRPGTGIPACELKNQLGQLLIRDVRANSLLDPTDLRPRFAATPVSRAG
jgi:N,N'-diacetyllegionaminate synthase